LTITETEKNRKTETENLDR